MNTIINNLKVWAFAYQIANEFDAVPTEEDYLKEIRESYSEEPLLEEALSRYSGYAPWDLISNLRRYISKLEEKKTMISTVVGEESKGEFNFPKLMRYDNDGAIILVTETGDLPSTFRGTCVHEGLMTEIGHYSKTWDSGGLKEFPGELLLKN